jgi:hypothetical protein
MKRDPGSRLPSVFRRLAPAIALAIASPACGGDDGPGAADGGGDPDAASPDGAAGRATGFVANAAGLISLTEGPPSWLVGVQTVYARLTDAVDVPPASLLASAGECEVWVHPLPAFCDPACQNGYCVGGDQCLPYPDLASAGDITLAGLVEPLTLEAADFGYTPDHTFAGLELWDDGAAITATAPGGDAPGFTLEVTGVPALEAQLDLESGGVLRIEDGADETIRWTAAESGRIQLGLAVGHHGSPYEALLLCETDDDGELVVPGDLITRFPRQESDLESHTSWLARFTRDVVDTGAGPIELTASSHVLIGAIAHD